MEAYISGGREGDCSASVRPSTEVVTVPQLVVVLHQHARSVELCRYAADLPNTRRHHEARCQNVSGIPVGEGKDGFARAFDEYSRSSRRRNFGMFATCPGRF